MRHARSPLLSTALLLVSAAVSLAQTPLGRLEPDEPGFYDFGWSVALAGTVAVVGEPDGGPKGRIHAFDVVTGERLWKLGKQAPPYIHLLGQALAADEGRVIAVGHHTALILDAGTGALQGLLRQPLDSGFGFESTVDLSGDRAALAVQDQAFLYDVDSATVVHTFDSPLPPEESNFGVSVALDGGLIAVGAPGTDLEGEEAVYVYDVVTGSLLAKLVRDGGAVGGQFGRAVDVHGDRILVGAQNAAGSTYATGAAYLFDAQGNQLARFVAPQAEAKEGFGASVHLDDRFAVVGASGANDAAGEVHVFDLESGQWLWSIDPVDREFAQERFGVVLDVDCERILTGAPGDQFRGAAYLHTLRDRALGNSTCGPANLNSTGASGELTAVGSAAVRCNLARLVASELPPGRVGVFLVSRTLRFVPFVNGSQGNLCLGGAIGRFGPVGAADGAGRLELSLDLRAVPQPAGDVVVTPGETWNFQVWYRDANPGSTSNLTDARTVTFE